MAEGRRREYELLDRIRDGRPMNGRERLELIVRLSVPSILAQLSVIIMFYIDVSMVGSLGAAASATIGLVETTGWLFGGLCSSAAIGFSVQVAHRIGAGDYAGARAVLRQGLVATTCFGLLIAAVGCAISGPLPVWLGGTESITADATRYFRIFALSLPLLQLNYLASGMLRSSGNMRVPRALNLLMCVLDVVFNALLIFPTRDCTLGGLTLTIPGAGLGVVGAALGTASAEGVTALLMTTYLCRRSPELALTQERGSFRPTRATLREALRTGIPIGGEHAVMCGAQILSTVIVAPLGNAAIAANSFAVTAESLCYMPGYGIGDAATTLVGQCKGARRVDLMRRFGRMTVWLGMAVMAFMGAVMYAAAPTILGIMTPDAEIRRLGTEVLRIAAFAEPMFAASIVAYGAFVGTGDTIVPSCMNFFSMWCVRLPLAALLVSYLGLKGVWIAMCIELCFRGTIFLVRLLRGRWLQAAAVAAESAAKAPRSA